MSDHADQQSLEETTLKRSKTMDCIFANYKETQHDRFLQYWVCGGFAQLKCGGFYSREADHVTNRKEGLRWASVVAERLNQNGFSDLYNDLKKLTDKYVKLQDCFNS
uniref:Uncharacterized protein n=1 Tax=Glossina palpalis gambiensis TaxID=67801 RepID=A0A1B0C1T5_9MUSC